jgi:hypothetical protein
VQGKCWPPPYLRNSVILFNWPSILVPGGRAGSLAVVSVVWTAEVGWAVVEDGCNLRTLEADPLLAMEVTLLSEEEDRRRVAWRPLAKGPRPSWRLAEPSVQWKFEYQRPGCAMTCFGQVIFWRIISTMRRSPKNGRDRDMLPS